MFSFWCVIDASRTADLALLPLPLRSPCSRSPRASGRARGVSRLNCSDSCSEAGCRAALSSSVRLLQNEGRAGVVRLGLFRVLRGLAESDRARPSPPAPFSSSRRARYFCAFSACCAQRLDLHLQLRDFVADAQQIVLGVAASLRSVSSLAVAAFGDARRLLKDLAPVGRF